MPDVPHDDQVMNAIIRGETPPEPTVKVYVRLGDNEQERTIAFRIPEKMDPMDLLERGATIDGNQAILTVAWDWDVYADPQGREQGAFTCPDLNDRFTISGQPASFGDFEGRSLTRVLGDCQRGLVKFFKDRGFKVQFS